MRNSDPGVRIVSVQRPKSDPNSILTMQVTGCNFQYGPNFDVSLDPSFWLWCSFFSWESVFTTGHCMKLKKLCSVFRHELLSNSEIVHPYKIYLICLVVTAFQFVLHIAAIEDFCYAGSSQSKSTSVLITLGTSEELHCSMTTGFTVLWWRVSYSSHISAIAP